MKDKKVYWFMGALLTVIVFMFVSTNAVNFAGNNQANIANKVVPNNYGIQNVNQNINQNPDEIQNVKLSMKNYQYVLEPSSLKKGVRVRMEADLNSLPGCSKSIVIPAFGVRKTVSRGNNIIEFTPDKSGTFLMSCSMNMYKGQFTVLESDGSSSNFVDANINAPPSGGSCGSGGCGCGGA